MTTVKPNFFKTAALEGTILFERPSADLTPSAKSPTLCPAKRCFFISTTVESPTVAFSRTIGWNVQLTNLPPIPFLTTCSPATKYRCLSMDKAIQTMSRLVTWLEMAINGTSGILYRFSTLKLNLDLTKGTMTFLTNWYFLTSDLYAFTFPISCVRPILQFYWFTALFARKK